VVDEAHRWALRSRVTYGGEGMASCINAGVDAPNHLSNSIRMGSRSAAKKLRCRHTG